MGGDDNFSILWGDTAVMRGDIELMGGPPTRENPEDWNLLNKVAQSFRIPFISIKNVINEVDLLSKFK